MCLMCANDDLGVDTYWHLGYYRMDSLQPIVDRMKKKRQQYKIDKH